MFSGQKGHKVAFLATLDMWSFTNFKMEARSGRISF